MNENQTTQPQELSLEDQELLILKADRLFWEQRLVAATSDAGRREIELKLRRIDWRIEGLS